MLLNKNYRAQVHSYKNDPSGFSVTRSQEKGEIVCKSRLRSRQKKSDCTAKINSESIIIQSKANTFEKSHESRP